MADLLTEIEERANKRPFTVHDQLSQLDALREDVPWLLARVRELETAQEAILAAFYDADYRECARFCDEVIDPSGALLGRVRARAALAPAEERADGRADR